MDSETSKIVCEIIKDYKSTIDRMEKETKRTIIDLTNKHRDSMAQQRRDLQNRYGRLEKRATQNIICKNKTNETLAIENKELADKLECYQFANQGSTANAYYGKTLEILLADKARMADELRQCRESLEIAKRETDAAAAEAQWYKMTAESVRDVHKKFEAKIANEHAALRTFVLHPSEFLAIYKFINPDNHKYCIVPCEAAVLNGVAERVAIYHGTMDDVRKEYADYTMVHYVMFLADLDIGSDRITLITGECQ